MQAGVGAGGGQLQAGGRGGRQGPGQVEEDDHGAEVQVQEQAYHEAGQSCQLHPQVLLVAKLLVTLPVKLDGVTLLVADPPRCNH